MRIRIEYSEDAIGSGVFWEGDVEDINHLRKKDLSAGMLANWVIKDGVQAYARMWYAYIVEEDNE